MASGDLFRAFTVRFSFKKYRLNGRPIFGTNANHKIGLLTYYSSSVIILTENLN